MTDVRHRIRTLNYIDLATLKHTPLSAGIAWDVQDFDSSHDGKRIAFVTNEDAPACCISRTRDRKILPLPKLPLGTLTGVNWHRDGVNSGFHRYFGQSPPDVYSLNAVTGKLTRWTQHETGGRDPCRVCRSRNGALEEFRWPRHFRVFTAPRLPFPASARCW